MSLKPGILNIYKIAFIATLMAAGIHHSGFTQTEEYTAISGQVVDKETQGPIPHVNVIVKGTHIGTSTNERGKFTIEKVPSGTQTLQFSHINYVLQAYTRAFRPDISATIKIEMMSRPIMIDEVEVVDTLPGRDTPRSPSGYYYGREDIEGTGAVTFAHLIQSLVPQARVRETGGDLYIELRQRSTIAQRYARTRNPYPLIIINGTRIGTSPTGLSGMLYPAEIEHLEIIRPPESQSIYGFEAIYGAIVVETKDHDGEGHFLSNTQRILLTSGLAAVMVLLNFLF